MKQGWIKSIRQSKGLIFLAVTDGAKDFQVTILQDKCSIKGELKVGASFEAQGRDSLTPKGLFEFLADYNQKIVRVRIQEKANYWAAYEREIT